MKVNIGEIALALFWWFPVYLAVYLLCERLVTTDYLPTQSALDALIPFCEWFVLPYCLWYPLLIAVGVYLLCRDIPAYHRYMAFLAATFFLSALIWFLYPNGQALRPTVMPRDNLLTALVSLIYHADTCTNVFPSVHVVGSLGALFAVRDCSRLRIRHPRVCRGVTVLAVLICLSTVFIKQHAVADVLCGVCLSLLVAIPVYCRSFFSEFSLKWA